MVNSDVLLLVQIFGTDVILMVPVGEQIHADSHSGDILVILYAIEKAG